MKKIILNSVIIALYFFVFSLNAKAQYNKKGFPFLYTELGVTYGNSYMYKFAITSIFPSNEVVTLGFYSTSGNAPNVPSDYSGGLINLFGGGLPQQTSDMVGLMYGGIFNTRSPNLRFLLRVGCIAGIVSTPSNFKPATNNNNNVGLLVIQWPNYDYTFEQKNVVGLLINPVLDLPLLQVFGLSFGFFANINTVFSTYGFEANIILGRLRYKTITLERE